MDPMVKASQEYLNATYGGNPGFNTITEDGITGWQTINAIIRGFQIDHGISPTADSFGPASQAAFNTAYGSTGGIVQQADLDTTEDNVYALIQCGIWCKGYSTGSNVITRHFYGGTGGGVKDMRADMGISASSSTVTLNIMKGLLSMDQYKLVPNGSNIVRGFQQLLNQRYESYIGIIPADGIFGRVTSSSLIYAIQAEIGLPVGVANGVFGPTTRAKTPTIPYGNNETDYNGQHYLSQSILHFSEILDFAMYINGFGDGIIDGVVSAQNVEHFQTFVALPSTGVVDIQTWMSLLLSTGDNTRQGTACDTRFEITPAHLANLTANNYLYVGRYLTGGDFKELHDGEVTRIITGGRNIYPIYQRDGTYADYFSTYSGNMDALLAEGAARYHSVPRGTVIYFAVDYDVMDPDVTNHIIPYFEAVAGRLSAYEVGIYAPRSVCSRVRSAGYSVKSFVSGMSTGYSGNIGAPLPSDWAFDQISSITINHAGDALDIDNSIASGLDLGFNTIAQSYVDFGETYAAPHLHNIDGFGKTGDVRVNLHNQSIPVYSDIVYDGSLPEGNDAGGYIIGYIHPDDCYCRAPAIGFIDIFQIFIHDDRLGFIKGYYNQSVPSGYPVLEWVQHQELFEYYNSDGTTLIPASLTRPFELKKDLDYMSHSGELLGVLSTGTFITPYSVPGETNSNFIAFETEIDNSTFNGFIDLGLQFGASPSTRAIW